MPNTQPTTQEDQRRVCEARSWLRQGYSTPERVNELMLAIKRHRGDAAATVLRDEMRTQWKCRLSWQALEAGPCKG